MTKKRPSPTLFALILIVFLLTALPRAPQAAAAPNASLDNNVWWNEVLHNTRDSSYRAPFGAVPTGQPITIRLRTAANDLTNATLVVYNVHTAVDSSGTLWNVQNTRQATDGTYDTYEFVIPASPDARTLYYKFRLQDGSDCDWYIDNYAHNSYDHEDRYENGTGMMVNGLTGNPCSASEDGYANNSFNITVYDQSAFTNHLDTWAANAVIYQILPDRFRNGDPANDTAWPYLDVYGSLINNHTAWNEPVEDARVTNGWSRDFFGGDLQGVMDELDYLQAQGVTAVYFNPIFTSSNHGYDTTDYLRISPRYGDNALFAQLNAEAEARGIKIILDGVFNHTGSDSVYFDRYGRWDANGNPTTASNNSGACENQSSSYNAFYTFLAGVGPCAGRTDGSQNYDAWWGLRYPAAAEREHGRYRLHFRLGQR
ncbi:MAG: alpha amylase N-terminal ig-like domain-containing protein [Chloroflexi bacterium]|nr:alpha amylase N-terminal ig-like domain-containing protein [Chloroflexota bacterium]